MKRGDSDFDQLVAGMDNAMLIVTVSGGGERSGCLVGFHSQCGISPPRYAVWLSKANHTYSVGAEARTFAIHLIPEGRHDLADLFGATSGDDVDKFARCAWTPGPHGVPLLDACPDRFIGRRLAWIDSDADHVCVILDPVAADRSGATAWLRLRDVDDVEASHDAAERRRDA